MEVIVKKILVIKADQNDGDYITSEHVIEGVLKKNFLIVYNLCPIFFNNVSSNFI